jgi:hypothetical protein
MEKTWIPANEYDSSGSEQRKNRDHSRQTELQREFPLHVVCSWLGNSPRIAQQSYLLVTEDDFARAAGVAKVMVEEFLGKEVERPVGF